MLAQVIDGVWGYEGGGKSARVGDGGYGGFDSREGWAGEWVEGWSVCMYVIIGEEYWVRLTGREWTG